MVFQERIFSEALSRSSASDRSRRRASCGRVLVRRLAKEPRHCVQRTSAETASGNSYGVFQYAQRRIQDARKHAVSLAQLLAASHLEVA
jgi:hypothetical protein